MPERSKKRPRDPNQLAYQIMLESTGQAEKFNPEKPVDPTKNPHAVALGRLGGLKGGAARAAARRRWVGKLPTRTISTATRRPRQIRTTTRRNTSTMR